MKRILFHPLSFILILLFVMIGGGIAILTNFILASVKQSFELRTGRTIAINGPTRFVISPRFGLSIHDVNLFAVSALAEPVIHAREVILPLSVSQILHGTSAIDRLIVKEADIEVIINDQGISNVGVEANPESDKSDVNGSGSLPIKIEISNGQLHFSDLRNDHSFEVRNIDAVVVNELESLNADGLALAKDQRFHFNASLASVARALTEGSPLDLNIDGIESSFAFSGRIATSENLNLAGQATLESENGPRLWQWLGAKTSGLDSLKKMSVTGAFNAQGPAFFWKQSQVQLGKMMGKGDISFSSAGEKPNLTADLNFAALDLNAYQPAKSSAASNWSEKAFDVSLLNALDAQFKITTDHLSYGQLSTGTSTIDGTLKDRKLQTKIKSATVTNGTVNLDIALDAQQLPPHLLMSAQLEKANAKDILPVVLGQNWLTGETTGTIKLESNGANQAEMMSKLSGSVELAVAQGAILTAEKNITALFAAPFKASLKLSIADGIASLAENSFSGSGDIDILRQALSITLAVPDKQKILITGPWREPKISAIAPSLQ